jgi:glycosyltransferase involved in cell wall biosynthesis
MLAYVGVMGILDGVDYALRALDILVHTHGREDISLVLMGDGDDVGRLHALANELKLDEYVNFVGWTVREDMVRYLSVADIGLSPEPENGLNELCTMNKILDYMAMGLPIVTFDLAETRFSAQGAALYATPNNVEDFANKVETLLDNEELRTSMGIIGRKRIEEELCWVHSKRDLLRAYRVVFPAINERSLPASRKQA